MEHLSAEQPTAAKTGGHPWPEGRRLNVLLISFAFACLFLLAGRHSATDALWLDELFSLTTAEERPGRMLELLGEYQKGYFDHPPLYFLILHYVLSLGNSPFILRLPSMVFMAVAVGIMAIVLRREGAWRTTAFAAVAGWSANYIVLYHATFARMYALVMLLGALLTWLLLSYVRREENEFPISTLPIKHHVLTGLGIAVLLAAMFYSTYMALILFGGIGFLGLMWFIRPPHWTQRKEGWTLIAGCALGALLILPWIPVMYRMLSTEMATGTLPVDRIAQYKVMIQELGGSRIGFVQLLLGWGLLCLAGKKSIKWWLGLAAFIVLPLAALIILSPPDRKLLARYVIYGIPILFIGSVMGWQAAVERFAGRKMVGKVIIAFIVLLPVPFSMHQAWERFMKPVPDWWHAARIIEANAEPNETILTGLMLSGEALIYHMEDDPANYSFWHYALKLDEFAAAVNNPGVIWYVGGNLDIPPVIQELLDRNFPYRVQFAGNDGLGDIIVYCKRPFSGEGHPVTQATANPESPEGPVRMEDGRSSATLQTNP